MRKVIVKGSWIIAAAVVTHVSPLAMAADGKNSRPAIAVLAETDKPVRPAIALDSALA